MDSDDLFFEIPDSPDIDGIVDDVVLLQWADKIDVAASGVMDGTLLPVARRRKEKELARLTTPTICKAMAARIRSLTKKFSGDKIVENS